MSVGLVFDRVGLDDSLVGLGLCISFELVGVDVDSTLGVSVTLECG